MGKTKRHEKKSKKKHKHKDKDKKKTKKSAKKSTKQKDAKQPKEQQNEMTAPLLSVVNTVVAPAEELDNFAIPVELMNNKSHAPETPAEYQRRQQHIRRVTDPETGRVRLIKGDGEVLEEIVTRERHADINKKATAGDGKYYQENTVGRHKRK